MTSKALALRSSPLHKREFVPLSLLVAICVVVAFAQRSAWAYGAVICAAGLEAFMLWSLRITVTADHVTIRYPPKRAINRSAIGVIRIWGGQMIFYDHERHNIMAVQTAWTKSQYLSLGEELGVPVYDHRTKFGLSDSKTGRLLKRPVSSDQRQA